MQFLLLVIMVLTVWLWYLMSNRHDGSVRCPKCREVNASAHGTCWNCRYEFTKPEKPKEELRTCSKCKGQFYITFGTTWEHTECYKCHALAELEN